MTTYKVEGGNKISGIITPAPNKNSILALIPAAILASKPVTFHNVPKSSSTRVMFEIFKSLGGKVAYLKNNSVKLDSSGINKHSIEITMAEKERASLMYLGPLLARLGQAEIADTGGCKLGNRPVDTLFQGLVDLGAKFTKSDSIFRVEAKRLKGNRNIWQLEASVTGTENLILAACLAEGETIIYNSAAEPHVQDMCNFLVSIGAKIEGIGTNRVTVTGVKELSGGEWTVIPDHIDIGGLIVAAAITDGDLVIKNAIPHHMTQILNYFSKINLKVEIEGEDLHVKSGQELRCKTNMKGDIDKIPDQPWPSGFPADLIPQAIVLAAKAAGSIRVYSMMYETQLFFVEELKMQGGKVIFADPHRVITLGPSEFKPAKITAPTIIQCAHACVLAALAAKGTSTIKNVDSLARRYPSLIETFNSLGAKISIEK